MKVHNQSGSKERLFEIFQKVNKTIIKESNSDINETFDVPVVDDKAYLDKGGDQPAEKEQPNKYDGGVDYPAIDKLKTKDKSLDKIVNENTIPNQIYKLKDELWNEYKVLDQSINNGYEGVINKWKFIEKDVSGNLHYSNLGNPEVVWNFLEKSLEPINDNSMSELDEISMSGLKGAANFVGNSIGQGVKNKYNQAKTSVNNFVDDTKKSYQKGAGNSQIGKLQQSAQKFGDDFGKLLTKVNTRAVKAGEEEIKPRQIGMVILNAIEKSYSSGQSGGSNVDLSRFRMQEEFEEEIDQNDEILVGGVGDGAEPTDFDSIQILKGLEIEMEHTSNPREALEITMDHLTEIPDYYDRLGDMEDEAGVEPEFEENQEEEELDGIEFEENQGDNSANVLLDPSQYWVDDYAPKKLGDDINEDSNVNSIEIQNIDPNDPNLLGEKLPSPNDPMTSSVMLRPETITSWKQEFINKWGAEGILTNDGKFWNIEGNQGFSQWKSEMNSGVSNWMNNYGGMDESNMEEFRLSDNGNGNLVPTNNPNSEYGIRIVEQPMGSGNKMFLIVSLTQDGQMDEILDERKEFTEATIVLQEYIDNNSL
jgi:hypothetical protein